MIQMKSRPIFRVLLLLNMFFVLPSLAESNLSSIQKNNQGVLNLQLGQLTEAQSNFVEALNQEPQFGPAQFNLALTLSQMNQLDKAEILYREVSKDSDPEVLFRTHFNLGEMAGRQNLVDLALLSYQEALQYKPDSLETKMNIELLIQQQQNQSQKNQEQQQQDQQNQDPNQKDQQQSQNQKDQKQDQKSEPNEKKQDQDSGDPNQDQKENQQYAKNRPQPKEFKSEELKPSDVNKILNEIKSQEEKIRAEFQKRDAKEPSDAKDW